MKRVEKERKSLLSTLALDDSLWDVKNVLEHRLNRSDPKYGFMGVKVTIKNPTQEVRLAPTNSLLPDDPDPAFRDIHSVLIQRSTK